MNRPIQEEFSTEPFFETSPFLLCIAGFDGYFRRINPAVSSLLGYTKEELLHRPIREFIHPNDLSRTIEHREELLTGKPLRNFENRYITKSGDVVWLLWHSIPVEQTSLVYAIAKNITHIKEREESLSHKLTGLALKNEDLVRLSYRTAHDIRSPVAGLISMIDLLDESAVTDPETAEIIQRLKNASEGVEQSLDLCMSSLHDVHSENSALEVLHLPSVIDSALSSIKFLLSDTEAELETAFDAFDTLIFNRSYLESIFQNLITNSIKYRNPKRRLQITISSKIVDGYKVIEVADNGLGFDAEKHRDRIFKKREHFHDNHDASGIGLYLVHHQLASLGGQVSVKSKPGEGACFSLRFENAMPT